MELALKAVVRCHPGGGNWVLGRALLSAEQSVQTLEIQKGKVSELI